MTDEIITIPGSWGINYDYSVRETASHFLASVRDDGQLLGRECPECGRVLAPPRDFCERCFVDKADWVEVSPGDRVESFTIVPQDLGAGPDVPFVLAYIQLDGVHTAMVNEVGGIDLSDVEAAAEELAVGTRLEAVFEPESESEGRITDFHYEPAD